MADGGRGSTSAPWVPARGKTDARSAIRILLGLTAVFIAVLAVLALLNSFFIQPAPGPRTPTEPGPGEQPEERGDQGDTQVTCQEVVDFLFWVFLGFTGLTLLLLGLAVALRHRSDGRILSNVWGILSIIGLFITLLAAGAWRLVDWMCNGTPNCKDLIDGFYVAYLILISLTIGSVVFGITFAHLRRISFFRTGFGVLGIVLYLPAILTGVGWWVLRTFCNPQLWYDAPCQYLRDTLDTLALSFWISLAASVAALVVGILYQRSTGVGVFRSGWAVLSIMLVVLAMLSGFGWLIVKDIHDAIPLCNPQEPQEEEEPEDPPTCKEILDRIALVFWIMMGIVAVLIAVALVFNHDSLGDFLKSAWMIIAYVVLALALLVGLGYLLLSSFCDADGDGQGGSGGQGGGTGPGGGGGGGSGPGGGGGGGVGSNLPRPVQFDPLPLSWVLIVLAGVLAVGLLFLLLRRRKGLGMAGPTGPPPAEDVSQAERARLEQILAKGKLASADAVVAAYRVFLAWASQNDLSKAAHETPAEHARRVHAKFADVPEASLQDFVGAYEVARLSNREPTEEERRLAVRFSKEILRGTTPTPPTSKEADA